LDEYSVLLLLLSSLTSAAMFAFKLSTLEVIKLSLDMDHVLEQQHADLKTDLQASLSPRDFRKVSQLLSEHAPRKFSILSHRQGPAAVVPEGSPQVRSEPVGAAFDAHASSICLNTYCLTNARLRRWNRMTRPTRTSRFCIRSSLSRPHLRSVTRLDSPT
jgi:hypothetical protein